MQSILQIVSTLAVVQGARILWVVPTPSHSHTLVSRTVYNELGRRGHQIVAFTTNSPPKLVENVTDYRLNYPIPAGTNMLGYPTAVLHFGMQLFYMRACRVLYDNQQFQATLKEQFDLVVIEWNVIPCFSVLGAHFGVPLVGIRSLALRLEGHDSFGNPTNPSYAAMAYNAHREGFMGRLVDFVFSVYWRLHHRLFNVPVAQMYVDEYFPHLRRVSVLEHEKSAEIVLTNSHYLFHGARPTVPAVVEIGGVHVGKDGFGILQQDLKSYLDASKDGFILFNMGSMIKSSSLSENMLSAINKTFSTIPYNIVWKFERDDFVLPRNVRIWKWLPQEAVLAHKNIKCFISHGGLLSVQEAIHYEVPIVAIPLLFDQPYNSYRLVQLGIGAAIGLDELEVEKFKNVVHEVITNTSYKENIHRLAQLQRDQPQQPLEKAIWWIEYVLRNKGAPHIRSKAVHMNWITYLMLDVLAFLFCAILLFIYLIIVVIRYLRTIQSVNMKAKDD